MSNSLWLARDYDGLLHLFKEKPKLKEYTFNNKSIKYFYVDDSEDGDILVLDPKSYSDITFEGSPYEVELEKLLYTKREEYKKKEIKRRYLSDEQARMLKIADDDEFAKGRDCLFMERDTKIYFIDTVQCVGGAGLPDIFTDGTTYLEASFIGVIEK